MIIRTALILGLYFFASNITCSENSHDMKGVGYIKMFGGACALLSGATLPLTYTVGSLIAAPLYVPMVIGFSAFTARFAYIAHLKTKKVYEDNHNKFDSKFSSLCMTTNFFNGFLWTTALFLL